LALVTLEGGSANSRENFEENKTFGLDFGGPGLKICVLEGNSYPAPVLEGEGRIYNIFGARAF
jgi:hypothetical protein